ncbi:hypothetical protein, partial [uncultured Campylobacter sp.]|uniref:hypothetical protein n=1 Tax=uncultured Campylobacter sp. TaxID=218934 RepID=UPI002605A09F
LAVFSFSSPAWNFKIFKIPRRIWSHTALNSKRRIIAKFILRAACGNRIYAQNAKSHGAKFT